MKSGAARPNWPDAVVWWCAYVQDKLQFPGRQAVPGFHELVLLSDIGNRQKAEKAKERQRSHGVSPVARDVKHLPGKDEQKAKASGPRASSKSRRPFSLVTCTPWPWSNLTFGSPNSAEPLSPHPIPNSLVLRRLKNPRRAKFVRSFRRGLFRLMPIVRWPKGSARAPSSRL
jgi:hypothetical protein